MPGLLPTPLVRPEALASKLPHPELVVLDASWHLPAAKRDARAEFTAERIPGARFFDLEQISDRESALPHMAPKEPEFGRALAALGVGLKSHVVVYDSQGIFSSARLWWLLRAFGKAEVSVLDGGLPQWRAGGRPIESGPVSGVPSVSIPFVPRRQAEWFADRHTVLARLPHAAGEIADARPATRFQGQAPEPRPGLRRGHIPGSRNLPWASLLTPEGTLRSSSELRSLFEDAGVALEGPVLTTCGSGVTAAILSLALEQLGLRSALYDGSWADWGRDSALPIEPA